MADQSFRERWKLVILHSKIQDEVSLAFRKEIDWELSLIGNQAANLRDGCNDPENIDPKYVPVVISWLDRAKWSWRSGHDFSALVELCKAWCAYGAAQAGMDKASFSREFGQKGATARLANDPKQRAKAEARKLWNDWQSGKAIHKSGAAFARYVVGKLTDIEDPKTVEKWASEWRSQTKGKNNR